MAATALKVVQTVMAEDHLRAVIVRITIGGKNVLTKALGTSMPGVPATTDMHFRNGAVAISYVSTALLRLVDEKKVALTDKLSNWLPEVPHSAQVTLGELAQMTAGYADYVQNAAFLKTVLADPFQTFTPQRLASYGTSQPLVYSPGTNWNYSHTDYVLLGLAMEKITGEPMDVLLQQAVLGPLGLRNTTDPGDPAIPEPVLHAYTSERRESLSVPARTPFYEESTFWNPSWTITHGAVQTTNIYDMTATADAVGTGKLLSPASHQVQVATTLRGRTKAVTGCASCFVQNIGYTYGLGVVISGDWLLQNPAFGGYGAVEAYLPSKKIAIAIAATYDENAFDATGSVANRADEMFQTVGATIAPDDAPPLRH